MAVITMIMILMTITKMIVYQNIFGSNYDDDSDDNYKADGL